MRTHGPTCPCLQKQKLPVVVAPMHTQANARLQRSGPQYLNLRAVLHDLPRSTAIARRLVGFGSRAACVNGPPTATFTAVLILLCLVVSKQGRTSVGDTFPSVWQQRDCTLIGQWLCTNSSHVSGEGHTYTRKSRTNVSCRKRHEYNNVSTSKRALLCASLARECCPFNASKTSSVLESCSFYASKPGSVVRCVRSKQAIYLYSMKEAPKKGFLFIIMMSTYTTTLHAAAGGGAAAATAAPTKQRQPRSRFIY